MDYGLQLSETPLGAGKVAGARSVSILAPADDGNPATQSCDTWVLMSQHLSLPLATALRFHARNSVEVTPHSRRDLYG